MVLHILYYIYENELLLQVYPKIPGFIEIIQDTDSIRNTNLRY